jgi:hypothetical protein
MLLNHKRPFAALDITSMCLHNHRSVLPPDLLVAVLRELMAVATSGIPVIDRPRETGGFGYELGELLTAIEEFGAADEEELALFEWAWLPALEHTQRGFRALVFCLRRNRNLT